MKLDREKWWAPTYYSGKGRLIQINGVSTAECPVSLTDGWTFQVLMDYAEAGRFEGAHMYGPDLSRWPARLFDAFALFALEDSRIENEKYAIDSGE